MNKIWTWILVIVVAAGVLWSLQSSMSAPSADNPVKLGAVLSLTGIAADYGASAKNGLQLAVDEINRNGGVEGRLVTLAIEDDHTDPKTAISAFRKLTSVDGVQGIVGGIFDFATVPLFPVADETRTALISPANMRIPGGVEPAGYSFVLMPDFKKVVRELKGYLSQSSTNKLAVVHFKSVFGQEIATTLSGVMSELGRGPIVDESYTQIGGNDFTTVVLKLKQQGVDTVFLDMVGADPVNFLSRAREQDYHPRIISYYGIIDSFATEGTDKSLLEGVVVLDWESSSDRFTKLYKERFGVVPTHSAEKSYLAAYAMSEAIANTANPSEVAAYLESHAIETPSGTIVFNKDHAVDSTLVQIKVVKNGELVPLN
jgi:branched-chain amino acid transport system substrate-binding protein